MSQNIHEGHRDRLRGKYLKHGLDAFEDHEVLELMLFYCIPYKDTNGIAHRLINEFGGLHNLFEADPAVISERGKLTKNAAVFVSMIPAVANRYFMSRWGKKVVLQDTGSAGHFAISLLAGKTVECFYVLCLDAKNQLICADLVSEGTINETAVYLREVVYSALKFKAVNLIFVHNHPSGSVQPSPTDIKVTQRLLDAFQCMNIEVLDHIIVGGNRFFSFAGKHMLGLEY